MVSAALLLFFPLVMAFAASSDLLTMRISNRLVLLLVVGFFPVALVVGMPFGEIGLHVLAGLAVLALTFGLFSMGWIGGGDAKLAAATALWLGFSGTAAYLLYAAVFGGVLTLILLRLRTLPLTPFIARHDWIARLHDRATGVPYGIALAIAAMMVYSQTAIFAGLSA
ncbi:peptidase [Arsenicitalea aurantiaca]|uniref:Peptidase n=1 Tax=Arsenicitalea aurantiaca TaxID=1783274 RepID=A0A433X256_9HYPH|nr:prepilin peptidase [Arsenicitalea aurantiaca]RUT28195.1 peptidase [Arsenicitalea aurantiaca]